MKRYFVTGAAGFLGSAICRQLVTSGNAVTGLLRPGSAQPKPESEFLTYIRGDINDTAVLRKALNGSDRAIHTASLGLYSRGAANPSWTTNTLGTENFLKCCIAEDIKQVVVTNSISVLSSKDTPEVQVPDFARHVRSTWMFPYLASKLGARDAVERARDRLNVITLYCAPMYGPGDKHSHTGVIIRYLATHIPWAAPPGGTSIVAVSDAADACIRAASLDQTQGEFVVTAEQKTFLQIYNSILRALGSKHQIAHLIPRWLYGPSLMVATASDVLWRDSRLCPHLVRNAFRFRCFSSAETQAALDWIPRASFDEAIAEQVQWMRDNQKLPL